MPQDTDLEVGNPSARSFGISAEELSDIIAKRDEKEVEELLKPHGGVEGLLKKLRVNPKRGLDNAEVEVRRKVFGMNRIEKTPAKSFLRLFYEALKDRTLIILMVASVISITLGVTMEDPKTGWIDGTAILMAVLVVALVTSINDYTKERRFRKLNDIISDRKISVIRGEESKQVSIYDVVVGDILILESGNFIPADGLFIKGHDLKVDESSMTGESDNVEKNEEDPFLLSGCKVMEGEARMLVIAVGEHSVSGKLRQLVDTAQEETPLQKKLGDLAERIGKIGVAAAILTFVSLLIMWIVHLVQTGTKFEWSMLTEVFQFLVLAITIIVVAVPEGLPMAVTLSLAFSMFKMMKDQNLVRRLEACETMGGATTICSDKTGTLTENKMTTVAAWFVFKEVKDISETAEISDKVLDVLAEGISLNSTAFVTINEDTGEEEYIGSKTECALLKWIDDIGYNYDEFREDIEKVSQYPFSSARKSMGTVIKTENGYRYHAKGAAEILCKLCSSVIGESGEEIPLDEQKKNEILEVTKRMAASGLRVLCLAYLNIKEARDWSKPPENNLTFLCLAGIKDPVRKDVPKAVKTCQEAGIVVRMLTGDNALTAEHIARECGILTDEDDESALMEGPEFRNLSDDRMEDILPKLRVLARASPEDKYKLVKKLRAMGEVVAVTGDGTNDAPQLKEADVGFSMGITGTEVAKEASDIVLLDDNFKSIVNAVKWGRNVYDSIRKFLQFQLTVNLVAVSVAFLGAVTQGESPLKPIQMLWVNIIMDSGAALALATEPPTDELLKRKPYGRFENVITNRMYRFIIGHAVFQIGVLVFLMYWAHLLPWLDLPSDKSDFSPTHRIIHTTLVFNTFVFMQIVNEFNARKLHNEWNCFTGIFNNYIFLAIIGLTVIIQVMIVQYGGVILGTHPLSWNQWLVCIAIALIELPYGLLLRMIPIRDRPKEPEEETIPLREERTARELWQQARKVPRGISIIRILRRERR